MQIAFQDVCVLIVYPRPFVHAKTRRRRSCENAAVAFDLRFFPNHAECPRRPDECRQAITTSAVHVIPRRLQRKRRDRVPKTVRVTGLEASVAPIVTVAQIATRDAICRGATWQNEAIQGCNFLTMLSPETIFRHSCRLRRRVGRGDCHYPHFFDQIALTSHSESRCCCRTR